MENRTKLLIHSVTVIYERTSTKSIILLVGNLKLPLQGLLGALSESRCSIKHAYYFLTRFIHSFIFCSSSSSVKCRTWFLQDLRLNNDRLHEYAEKEALGVKILTQQIWIIFPIMLIRPWLHPLHHLFSSSCPLIWIPLSAGSCKLNHLCTSLAHRGTSYHQSLSPPPLPLLCFFLPSLSLCLVPFDC